jgi:hypothetical protein
MQKGSHELQMPKMTVASSTQMRWHETTQIYRDSQIRT